MRTPRISFYPSRTTSALLVVLFLAIGAWSALTLHLQTDIFSLFPQELTSLKALRSIQKDYSFNQKAFVVVDPSIDWTEEQRDTFWQTVDAEVAKSPLVAETSPRFFDHKMVERWMARTFASLPPEEFTRMVQRLEPSQILQRGKASREKLRGALDEEELLRLRLDPLGLFDDLQPFPLSQKQSSAPSSRSVLQVAMKDSSESFEACQKLEADLATAVQNGLVKIARLSDRPLIYLTGDPMFTAQISGRMKHDMMIMLVFTLALVLLSFWFVYRSLRPLGWIALSQVCVVSASLLAAKLFIGELNVVSMGFASILIGVSIDYCILVYHHFAMGENLDSPRWRLVVKGIWFSSATTALTFAVLLASSFPGLRQLALLVSIGLLASAAFATTILASQLNRHPPSAPPNLSFLADQWGHWVAGSRGLILLLLGLLLPVGGFLAWKYSDGSLYDGRIERLQPSHLEAYKGHTILKASLPSEPSQDPAQDTNKNLWPNRYSERIKKAIPDNKINAATYATSLNALSLLDEWREGREVFGNPNPGFEEWKKLKEDLDHQAKIDFSNLTFFMALIMGLLCYAAHRSWRLVVLNLGSLLIAFLVLLLVMETFGASLTLVSLLCIPLLIGVTLDYTMHVLLGLEHERGNIQKTFHHLLIPISLTGAASVIGFTAPALSSQPALVNFGLVMDAGIFCAVLTALIALPAAYGLVCSDSTETKHYSRLLYRAGPFQMAALLAKTIPNQCLRNVAWVLGFIYAQLSPHKVEVVRKNLSVLGEQVGTTERARRVFANFAATLADYFYLGSLSPKKTAGQLREKVGHEHLLDAHKMGKGCLLLTPHLSLFELGGALLSELGCKSVALTIPEPTPELTQWRSEFRQRWGVSTLEVGSDPFSSLPILRALEENKFVIALVDRPHSSLPTPISFPNGTLQLAGGILMLAAIARCPVVVGTITRTDQGGYRAEVSPAFFIEPKETRDETLRFYAQKIADILLPTIQAHSDEWYQFTKL